MIKKIIVGILFACLLVFISYEIYSIDSNDKKITELNVNISKESGSEYLAIYDDMVSEYGEDLNIANAIGLLNRKKEENDELLSLLAGDLNNLIKENNAVEQEIAYLIEQEEKRKNASILEGKITYSQFPKYPTGCESVGLYILLKYNGVDTTIDEIVGKLKKGDLPYTVGGTTYGGNPEVEFIGDPRNNYSYGVYNKPLADVANSLKSGVTSKIGLDFDSVLALVKEGKPVLVWTTINLSKPFKSSTWTYKPTGEKITWISGEHVMVVIGFDPDRVVVSDPYTGTIRYFDKELFRSRYNYLGKRVLYY